MQITDLSLEQQTAKLAQSIERFTGKDGAHQTALSPLIMYRSSVPSEPVHSIYTPVLCLIAQGRKQMLLGSDTLFYDPSHYLFASVTLPMVGQVVSAAPAKPYLALSIGLDPAQISGLSMEAELPPASNRPAERGMFISRSTPSLLDAVQRFVNLLETPEDIPILAPLIQREILYRLLVGEQGARLRQFAAENSQTQRIARAIHWLQENYDQPFRIEEVAKEAYMSPSGLHHHFKAVTAMSPLQFQKQLRLQEARRLMLGENMDATTASYQVGYDSPSQFSREYSRLFGSPPLRDIARLRNQGELPAPR
jgi:AraC-like DNA-binding protein